MLIKHDSLVRLNCKRGKAMSPEYYRVLGFFSKYYNKWWVAEENQFSWTSGSSRNKSNRILGRLMKKVGSSYREVELKAVEIGHLIRFIVWCLWMKLCVLKMSWLSCK